MLDAGKISMALIEKCGIGVKCDLRQDENGLHADIKPLDLDPAEGFTVRVSAGWRRIESVFIPGNFSANLINAIAKAEPHEFSLFQSFASSCRDAGDTVAVKVNELPVDPFNREDWPAEWSSFSLQIISPPVAIDRDQEEMLEDMIIRYGGGLLLMVVSLVPLKERYTEELPAGLPEGAKQRIEVNRYERSHINRAACISRHGAICAVCGFDFHERYGDIGKGYIHVHHIVPVSQLGEGYVVNPTEDLVPVCPNCHSMLHRKDPPFTVMELRDTISSNSE